MKKIFITLTLVGFVLFTIPFFLPPGAVTNLSVGVNFLSGLASLVTLFIALLLYSKYGVEKSILTKQTEVVFNLLVQLKKTAFWINWKDHTMQLRLDRLSDNYWKKYKSKHLVFNSTYAVRLSDIWEIADNIFLPTEIAETIDPLLFRSIAGQPSSDGTLRLEVIGGDKEDRDSFGELNGEQITLQEFVELWSGVINKSKFWLKTHSKIYVDLNFERK